MSGSWTLEAALARVRAVRAPITQAALAAGIAWYVARDLLGHSEPFFAPIAAAVALSTSHVQRARRTVQMIVGVLLGIGVSELLHTLIGDGAISIGLVVLVTLAIAVAVGGGFVGEGMMFVNQAASSAILVIALHKAGTGGERATDALVGGAVAFVIGVGLFPANPLKLLWSAERGVLKSLLSVLERDSAPAEDLDWELAASHDVHRRLTTLTQARNTARASVRIAPRRMLMRDEVEGEERRVARMYLLASAVLAVMRTMRDLSTSGDAPPPPQGVQQLDELRAAMRALLDAPRPWPQGGPVEVSQRLEAMLARDGIAGSAARDTLGAALRRVGEDILALVGG